MRIGPMPCGKIIDVHMGSRQTRHRVSVRDGPRMYRTPHYLALNKALDESPPLIGASKAQHGHSSRQRHTNRTDRACQETVSQESTED